MSLNVSILLATIFLFALFCILGQGCHSYPAVFNFGDSNSDTGGLVAGLGFSLVPPNGQTYFEKPSGRFCDGRLVLDFLVNAWGLPFLAPYLDSVGSPSFRTGCNFATGGCTILPANATSFSPFSFGTQVSQFVRFKARVLELLSDKVDPRVSRLLPQKEFFAQGLYAVDMGQNDLDIALTNNQLVSTIPNILSEFETGIKKLYDQGARNFWIHNVSPMGCLPIVIAKFPNDRSKLDKSGCVKSYNEAAQQFNVQFQALCKKFQKQFTGVNVTYIDMFTIKSNLISNFSRYGFKQPIAACCGYGGLPLNYDSRIKCGQTKILNGRTVTAGTCKNPAEYIHWDSNHQTDAANYLVSQQILTGKHSDRLYSETTPLTLKSDL